MVVQCSGFEWAAKATISFTSAAKQVASPRPEAIQATCSLFIRPSPTNQYLDGYNTRHSLRKILCKLTNKIENERSG